MILEQVTQAAMIDPVRNSRGVPDALLERKALRA
jgi:hypothetical protein